MIISKHAVSPWRACQVRPRLWLALWTAPPETVKNELSCRRCASVPTDHDGRGRYDRGARESKQGRLNELVRRRSRNLTHELRKLIQNRKKP
jgi:hypothetical protein